jgi:hypothetical protein
MPRSTFPRLLLLPPLAAWVNSPAEVNIRPCAWPTPILFLDDFSRSLQPQELFVLIPRPKSRMCKSWNPVPAKHIIERFKHRGTGLAVGKRSIMLILIGMGQGDECWLLWDSGSLSETEKKSERQRCIPEDAPRAQQLHKRSGAAVQCAHLLPSPFVMQPKAKSMHICSM